MSAAIQPTSLWNRSFILSLLNNFFLFVYYYALLTNLPIFIVKKLGGTLGQSGLALTVFLISSITVRPFAGVIIERLGKKKTLWASAALFCLFSYSYLLIDSIASLLVIRFIHGIWFSILTTATVAVVNDFIPEQQKGEGMGYFVMSTNLAVVFGPLVALTLVQYISFNQLFLLLALVISLGFLFCLSIKVQDQVHPAQLTTVETNKKKISLGDLVEHNALPISIIAMFSAFAYGSIMSFISIYSDSKGLLQYSSLFFILFAVSMVLVRPLTGKLYDRKGASAILYPCLFLFAVGLVVISQMDNLWTFILSAILIGIGYGSLLPCYQTLAIQASPKHRISHATSTFFTLFDSGMALGSFILGVMVAHYGYSTMYLFCAGIVLLNIVFYRLMLQKRRPIRLD